MVSPPFRVSYRERHLELPDQYSGLPCADNPDFDAFANLPSEGGRLILDISLDDFTRLLSSIVVGSEIIYPDDAYRLQDIFAFAVNCNGLADDEQECEILVVTLQEIVDAVCACVTDSEQAIKNAIDEASAQDAVKEFLSNPDVAATPPNEVLDERLPVMPRGDVCNNDNAYSVSLAITKWLHASALDMFDSIIAAANTVEYVDELIQAIPFLAAPYKSLAGSVEFFTEIDNWGKQAYESSWTTALEDELACDLFNIIACNNCEVSFTDVTSVWERKILSEVGQGFLNADFSEYAAFVSSLITNTNAAASVMVQYVILRLIELGNNTGVSSGGYHDFQQEILKARDEENNDWSVECGQPDCEYEYVWNLGDDFSPVAQFVTSQTDDVTVDGSGIVIGATSAAQQVDSVQFDSSSRPTFLQIEFSHEITNTQFGGIVQLEVFGQNGGTESILDGSDGTYQHSLVVTSDGLGSDSRFGLEASGTGERTIVVTKIVIRGAGANPYV